MQTQFCKTLMLSGSSLFNYLRSFVRSQKCNFASHFYPHFINITKAATHIFCSVFGCFCFVLALTVSALSKFVPPKSLCFVLCYSVLFCFVLCCSAFFCFVLCCSVLFCPVLNFVVSVLQCSHQKVQVHVPFYLHLHQEHKKLLSTISANSYL